uniref:anterior gradient protein 2 homolog n=1 Tax=Doryrhamphus excisus TaxID=161450 RepID=UPI0025AE32B9|nr:anterior gradient protein 2 homolog [Doryrhamphus excisus]
MMKASLSLLLVLVAGSCTLYIPKSGNRIPQTLSRGWGDQLIWAQTYEEGLYWARSRNKPLMVIFHLEDSPHCLAFKKVFAENDNIQRILDEDFIVINLMYETTDEHLSPDGHYVPRIIFVDPSTTVRNDITGQYSNRLYAYEPQDLDLLISNMEKAKKLLQSELSA